MKVRRGIRRLLAAGLLALASLQSNAGEPGGVIYPPPYRFPYPTPGLNSTPHLRHSRIYSLHSQACPGRWVWLMPQFHAIRPTHRGYYDNYLQLQFLRNY